LEKDPRTPKIKICKETKRSLVSSHYLLRAKAFILKLITRGKEMVLVTSSLVLKLPAGGAQMY
jgi:hypothetical protein